MTNQIIRNNFSYADCERLGRAIKKGQIWYADLSGNYGSEQGGMRPVLIIQNDVGNRYSPTTIIVPITSRSKSDLPTHMTLKSGECGLIKDSIVLFEQPRTIDKVRLGSYIGSLTAELLEIAQQKLSVTFA